MKFIRAFWGDLKNFNGKHRNEIICASNNKSLNDIVYVWGEENNKFLKLLGYQTVLISARSTEYGDDFLLNSNEYMIHKLISIKKGIEQFGEVIFLDWDCFQIKPIDKKFYELLYKRNNTIQMPLYIYPKNYSDLVLNSWIEASVKEKEYVIKQQEYLEKYHYDWENSFVTPNAGFIYSSNSMIIDELIRINYTEKIGIASEEMSFLLYSKTTCKTLSDYVNTYEPYVCDAKNESHFNQSELNKFISQFMEKNLYFIHE